MIEKGKITNYQILIFLALPYLVPAGLVSLPIFSVVSKIKYISILYMLFMNLKKGVIKKNVLVLSVLVFCIVLVGITAFKGTDVVGAIKSSVDMLFPILWTGKMLELNERKFLKFLTSYYSFLAIVNIVFLFIFPNGIVDTLSVNAVNLLGDDNKMIFSLICCLGISLYYNEKYVPDKSKKFNSILYAIIFFAALLIVWSATGIVAMFIVLLMQYLDNHIGIAQKIFNLRNIVIAVGLLFYFAVFSNVFQQGLFADFMVNVLHKNVTFSARTTLWTQAISKIMSSPVLGYGYGIDILYDFFFTTAQGIKDGFSCHNGYLRLLLEGGIVLLLCYIMIFLNLYYAIKDVWIKNKSIHILIFCMAGFLIACIFEAEYYSFLFLVLLEVIYYSKNTEKRVRC